MQSMSDDSFAARIRERYPEGLTGVFAIGGTRTTYILEQNRHAPDPGYIEDFSAHSKWILNRYWDFVRMYLDLGGQNMIITAFSFRGFYNRGEQYAAFVAPELLRFIDDSALRFYRENNVDPYLVGVDSLLCLPKDSPAHKVGQQLIDFQKQWPYQEGRYKLIWEVASIPLYSFWNAYQSMNSAERAAFEAELNAQTNLEEMNRLLFQQFSRAVYGTDVPMPHFYLGTNKSGDLKWRSPMPLALSGGDYLRMFYTPYPSLFIRRETLQTILEDLAFKDRFYSAKTDYSKQFTPDLAEAEYQRIMELSSHPETTLGLSRRVKATE